MSSSTKSIFPLFESVHVLDGVVLNAEYHSRRFEKSYEKFYWDTPNFELFEDIYIPDLHQKGKVKLRISYNKKGKKHSFSAYLNKVVQRLKIVYDDSIDYDLKFEDRNQLNALFDKRMDCDDVLIVKNGWLTDSSYANIALWDGSTWHTPTTYLLKGTKRTQLLERGKIQEAPISLQNLWDFQGFQLINAMLDFRPDIFLPIENIKP